MLKSACIIVITLLALGIFEFSPAVKLAQSFVSVENYKDIKATCTEILSERPWYGKFNYWFFAWFILVPAIIFSVSPAAASWLRAVRVIVAIGVSYALINMTMHLHWEIRNAPFQQDPYDPDPLNGWRMDCANYAGDGFSYMLAWFLGWIPASIYTGLYLYVWRLYHLKFSESLMGYYKSDIATCTLFLGLKIYFICVSINVALIAVYILHTYITGEYLFDPSLLKIISFLILRALLMPFEIFTYI